MGAGRSRLSVMLDLGKMQEVPPQEQVLLEHVETAEAYRTRPIDVQVDRYRYHGDQTLLVITADLTETGPGEKPAVIARLTPIEAAGGMRLLGEDSFRIEQTDDARMGQGRLAVAPGKYQLTLMVADPVKVETSLHRSTVNVPAPSDRMRFSDIIWAEELASVSYRAMVTYDEPYIVGPFRVLPKLSSIYRPGDSLKMFYEVYGGTGPYRISYQLEGQEVDGSWVPLGQPQMGEQTLPSQGWELPTSARWPLGAYRVRVEVTDAEGRLITAQVPFSLETS